MDFQIVLSIYSTVPYSVGPQRSIQTIIKKFSAIYSNIVFNTTMLVIFLGVATNLLTI